MPVRCLSAVALCTVALAGLGHAGGERVRITWSDAAPVRAHLEAHGVGADGFEALVERLRTTHAARVREGDLDHLVFYLLQSRRFTSLPAIEPAISAKTLVDRLPAADRGAFLRGTASPPAVSDEVRARIDAFVRAADSDTRDERLAFFGALLNRAFPDSATRNAALAREYLRVMRFVYEKEFIAQRSVPGRDAVATLYRTRGLSTDTAVEAGFLVHQGLGVVRSLEPTRRVRRVLIVGPGLDLAPRTALVEAGPPVSYQPWAVLDALLALGLSTVSDLEIVAADINPRVVEHLRRVGKAPPMLTLASELRESATLSFSNDFRDYFARLGLAIGTAEERPPPGLLNGHLHKTIRVRQDVAATLRAADLDIVVERLAAPPFDLVVATNVLPYFDDVGLALAMTNVVAMLGPGGILLHNEARPSMHELTMALRLPLEQSRHAVIASVRGAPVPLADSVWIHRRK